VKRILGAAGSGGEVPVPGPKADRSVQFTPPSVQTIPGQSAAPERQAAVQNYASNNHASSFDRILGLAQQLTAARDQPDTTVLNPGSMTTAPQRNTSAPGSKPSGSGGKNMNIMELFWNGQGAQNWDEGAFRPQGYVSGHTDHVHVSAGPNTILQLAKRAQQLGLHVGENPAFGGVDPVHAQGSYHYKTAKAHNGQMVGEGIDVSGDPHAEQQFARLVARFIRQGAGHA
jgi:hypothetical protein